MNKIHVLLSIHNTHVLLRHEDMSMQNTHVLLSHDQKHVLLYIHNTHVLLRHESDTCITVYYTCFVNTHVLL